jgi:hypothetical protein
MNLRKSEGRKERDKFTKRGRGKLNLDRESKKT